MSADFWAGYISGAVGIVIGNPLDILKVRRQAGKSPEPATATAPFSHVPPARSPVGPAPPVSSSFASSFLRPFLTGTAAPVLGYGALNALLFVSYNRTEAALNAALGIDGGAGAHLGATWVAGAVGGLATWAVSTPTELIKCRTQLAIPPTSSWAVVKQIWRAEGIRGLYLGGVVTALRDSVGYGFYFWSYELTSRWMMGPRSGPLAKVAAGTAGETGLLGSEAARVLLCGGLAGVVTWASIFPLDVIKTRVQTQALIPAQPGPGPENAPLLAAGQGGIHGVQKRLGAWEVAQETYREGGLRPFFRGLAVCTARAFIVNAFQWAMYEWIMLELGQGRRKASSEVKI